MKLKTGKDRGQEAWLRLGDCVFLFSLLVLSLWGATLGLAAMDQAEAPAVVVRASVDRTEVTIGDPIRYTISVTAPAGVEVEIPLLGEQLGDFTVLDFGDLPPRTENDRVVTSRWFRLTIFQTGQHLLPGPTIRYRQPAEEPRRIDGNDVSITVTSLLAQADQNSTIRDIKPPEALPFDWRPYGLAALAVLALAGLGSGLFFYLRRPSPAVAPPAPAAYQVAVEALRRLRAQGLIEKNQFETYYVSLSAIVREYLEEGLQLRAPEMTTEEFLSAAARDSQLSAVQQDRLAEFLSQADLVKFARHRPGLDESETAYRAARRFIEETRPQQDQDARRPAAAATEVSDALS